MVATRWGAKIIVDTADVIIAPWLLLDGLWEADVTAWLQATLRPGQVFVDVGANIGYFTVLAGMLVGPEGRVVGVEAHPHVAGILRRNVVMNGLQRHVDTYHRAAWSEPTTLEFHLRVHYSASSSVSSAGEAGLASLHDVEEVVQVQAVPLDELLAEVPRVDVMKIDVEGAEVRVVQGLERTLRANPGITIMFEWSPDLLDKMGDSGPALVDLLSGHGFGFRQIDGDLVDIDRHRLLDLPYGNIVARR